MVGNARMAAAVLLLASSCSAFTPPPMHTLRAGTFGRGRAFPSTLSAQAKPAGECRQDPPLACRDAGRRDILRLLGGGAALAAIPGESLASEGGRKGTVLVVGATGPIGQCVCQQLLFEGYSVRALTRRSSFREREGREDAGWTGEVKWEVGDLTRPESLRGLLKGVDKVVWCAGSQAYRYGIELNRLIYCESVGAIAKLAKEEARGLSSFVLVSSNAVTRFSDPDFGGSDYLKDALKWKAQGEALLRDAGVPYSILRFAAYYGANGVEATPDNIWITQGDPPGRRPMSLANLSLIVAKCLSDPRYSYKTFETSEATQGRNPGGDWEEAMDKLVDDARVQAARGG